MIGALRIIETDEQLAAVVHLQIPRDQMQAEMPVAIQELQAALASQRIEPLGPLLSRRGCGGREQGEEQPK